MLTETCSAPVALAGPHESVEHRGNGARRPLGGALPLAVAGLTLGLLAAPLPALAQAVANEVYAGCVLDTDTIDGLEDDIEGDGSGIEEASVDFVVVYTLQNDNNGQLLDEATATGPVICRNSDLTDEATSREVNEPIEDGAAVDTLDVASAFVLRYRLPSAAEAPDNPAASRFCHTVDSTTQCFDIPADAELEGE